MEQSTKDTWAEVKRMQEISRKPGTAQIIVTAFDFKSSVALSKFIDMLPNARIMWGTTLFMCIEFSQPEPVPTILTSPKFGGESYRQYE